MYWLFPTFTQKPVLLSVAVLSGSLSRFHCVHWRHLGGFLEQFNNCLFLNQFLGLLLFDFESRPANGDSKFLLSLHIYWKGRGNIFTRYDGWMLERNDIHPGMRSLHEISWVLLLVICFLAAGRITHQPCPWKWKENKIIGLSERHIFFLCKCPAPGCLVLPGSRSLLHQEMHWCVFYVIGDSEIIWIRRMRPYGAPRSVHIFEFGCFKYLSTRIMC